MRSYMLTNIGPPSIQGNFCENRNHPVKPHIMEPFNWHTGYIENSDRMTNSYLMSWHTLKSNQ